MVYRVLVFGPPESPRANQDEGLRLERTIDYTYDNLYRLTEAEYSTGEQYTYAYDPVGNRLQQIIDGQTTGYTYDAANRLESVARPELVEGAGQAVAYSYDRNGNRLSSDTLTNTWDAANRLVSSTPADPLPEPVEGHGSGQGQAVSNLYDGNGNRVGQTVGGMTTTTYALDAAMGLAEVIFTSPLPEPVEGNGSGQVAGHAYLHLPGLIVTESASGTRRYLLSDGLGSVRHVTDEAGQLVSTHEFDPYGVPLTEPASDPYGYTGEWWQADIGLLHLRARWYDPQSGTFLSRDPWEGFSMRPQSMNGWIYAESNPIMYTDPSGFTIRPVDIPDDATYSCRCGCIDWKHATPQRYFLKSLKTAIDNSPTNWVFANNLLPQIPSQYVIWRPFAQSEEDFYATALGIFVSSHNMFEQYHQGDQFDPRMAQSSGSAEDLSSNLIGFYRGMVSFRYNQTSDGPAMNDLTKKFASYICGVVGYDEYVTTGDKEKFSDIHHQIYEQMYPLGQFQAALTPRDYRWGTRPEANWNGIAKTSDCKTHTCPPNSQDSELLPFQFINTTPKSPLTSWAWMGTDLTADVGLKQTVIIGMYSMGSEYTMPPIEDFMKMVPELNSTYLNQQPLNWIP